MKLEEQILSIKQVRGLQGLGFDVEKHSSVEVNITTSNKQYIVHSSFFKLYPEFGDDDVIERYSTMNIGDIINVLPFNIDTHYFLSINSEFCTYSMSGDFDTIFFTREKGIMNNLFNTLVWCIKQKHIKI